MSKHDRVAQQLLLRCLSEQGDVDKDIGKLLAELAELDFMSSASADDIVQRAITVERNASWVLEELGRLDFFGAKGRRLSLPAEAFVLALTRSGIQAATANVLGNIALILAQRAEDDSVTATAIEKLNLVQAWKQRYDGNGLRRKIRRRYQKWVTKWSGAEDSPSGRDIVSRIDAVETGLRRVHLLDTIDFQTVPGLSAITTKDLKDTPYARGLRLLQWVADGGEKPDARFGYREIILAAATREIQLGQINAAYIVYSTKSLLAAVRAAAYFMASHELALAGDKHSSANAAVAAQEDLRRAQDKLLGAARQVWADRLLLKRTVPKLPFAPEIGPEMIEQLVARLSAVMGGKKREGVAG
jgi:hypothetical protein